MATPLVIPDDPRFQTWTDEWPAVVATGMRFPRSYWLHEYERRLREHYPSASSEQLTLTARLAAPFPLTKPGVP